MLQIGTGNEEHVAFMGERTAYDLEIACRLQELNELLRRGSMYKQARILSQFGEVIRASVSPQEFTQELLEIRMQEFADKRGESIEQVTEAICWGLAEAIKEARSPLNRGFTIAKMAEQLLHQISFIFPDSKGNSASSQA